MNVSENIHNFMEYLVGEEIAAQQLPSRYSADFIEDLCCLALNQLPPRYIRYQVDLLTNISDEERQNLELQVRETVSMIEQFLLQDRRKGGRNVEEQ